MLYWVHIHPFSLAEEFRSFGCIFPLTPKGFASLEAKRKFRVPRVTSKFTDPLDKSIPSPSQQASEEGASPKLSVSDNRA